MSEVPLYSTSQLSPLRGICAAVGMVELTPRRGKLHACTCTFGIRTEGPFQFPCCRLALLGGIGAAVQGYLAHTK